MAKEKVVKIPRRITISEVPFDLHKKFKAACKKKGKSMNARIIEMLKNDLEV